VLNRQIHPSDIDFLFLHISVKLNSMSRPTTRAKNIKQKGGKKTQPQKLRQESANRRPSSSERKKTK
jgi:hypothetical protein